ncbi:hypothetical protein [Peterkaempfera bronchialis]|uniref:hypothetical protein n=1 Tax=Peterkaempfera bronchialis TaxID=2126346 RepID=UPI001E5653C5|nr:hypothetical protein [Peterkaempfera bronchialis]
MAEQPQVPDPAPLPQAPEEGISLRQLLMALGEPLVELQAAPAGLDVEVRDVAILDPEDPAQALPGELVLAIGARGRAALPALRAAGAAGAAAVAVKLDAPGRRRCSARRRRRPGWRCCRSAGRPAGSIWTRWPGRSWAAVARSRARAAGRPAATSSRWRRPRRC